MNLQKIQLKQKFFFGNILLIYLLKIILTRKKIIFIFKRQKNRRDSLKKENKITSLDFKPPVKLDFNMSEIPIETLKELKLKWDKTQEIMEDFYRQTLSF